MVHGTVGLQHASMAIYNAYADRVPMLVLTANGSVASAVSAMRAGATDFLVKPLAAERILEGARGWGQNDFKLPLAKNAIVQALTTAMRGTEYARGERE